MGSLEVWGKILAKERKFRDWRLGRRGELKYREDMKQSFLMSLKTMALKAPTLTEDVLEVQILRAQPISTESESSGWGEQPAF